MPASARSYLIEEWPSLTAETIDWHRWNEDDELLAISMEVPVPIAVCDATWQELLLDVRPVFLWGPRREETAGWVVYEVNKRIFAAAEVTIRGVLEFQDRGANRTLVRLWTKSPGPSGSNRRSYLHFSQVNPLDFVPQQVQTVAATVPSTADLIRVAVACTDQAIAFHVYKKAEVAELKSLLGTLLGRLITSGHLLVGKQGLLDPGTAAQTHEYRWPLTQIALGAVTLAGCGLWLLKDPGFEPVITFVAAFTALLIRLNVKRGFWATLADTMIALILVGVFAVLSWLFIDTGFLTPISRLLRGDP